jgi:hypothetical protein
MQTLIPHEKETTFRSHEGQFQERVVASQANHRHYHMKGSERYDQSWIDFLGQILSSIIWIDKT